MQNFKPFGKAVAAQFAKMSANELFRVNISGDEIWNAYLDAFPDPEITNPIFRSRREHDGSYDKNTVRKIGNVVHIDALGMIHSMWDAEGLEYPYKQVAEKLSAIVRKASIAGLFRHDEIKVGYETTREGDMVWDHFHATITGRHYTKKIAEFLGEQNTTASVMRAGGEKITSAALDLIIDMISSNQLYRGAEFLPAVQGFAMFKRLWDKQKTEQTRTMLLWVNYTSAFARFKNSVMGELAMALSEGKDTEAAVAAYEKMVAPENYKRPTAVITQGMIDKAMETISSLGLEPSLERRFAKISDVSVNNVLWVSNKARKLMKDGIAGLLESGLTTNGKTMGTKVEEVSIDTFMSSILPQATALDVLLKGRNIGNLMSLTAPVAADAKRIFKWDNGFGWSYKGNVTDSIKEKVKAAGGNINADLRISLAWHNTDDLDLHCVCPYGHIDYGNKMGILDVDANAPGAVKTRTPVENLAFMKPRKGSYKISVNQYQKRENTNVGFTLQVEHNGTVREFTYSKVVDGKLGCLTIMVGDGDGDITITQDLREMTDVAASQRVWGVDTETLVPVSTVMFSPNYWDDQKVGNKHWFFTLEGCINDEPTRGIYNEYLRSEFEQHRKVFEVVGNKTKCPVSDEQLSGVGFSSTKGERVTIQVTTNRSKRLYEVQF